jgi:L-threonylcarbamoyladenylate synthase
MPEILKVTGNNSEDAVLTRAAEILTRGGVIAYPTETFYGLGVDATNETSIRKIYTIKGRNFNNPISIIIDKTENLQTLVQEVPDNALKLMQAFWPGALTIVFKASVSVSSLLTAHTGKVGIRVSGHTAAGTIAAKLRHPVTATSANLSGTPECSTADEVAKQIGDKLDAIVDLGKTAGGLGSTIIDVTFNPAKIIRQGAIGRDMIEKYINVE